MSSIQGIIIFRYTKNAEELNQLWNKWLFLGSDEKYHKLKRETNKASKTNLYILPFDYGYFETNEVIPISEIEKEKLEDIAFIITPKNEFLYYYDYEAADMSDYYKYLIYLKPSFNEIIEQTIEKYKDYFVSYARCQ
ncbi:hypothetical protein GXP67_25365 [Rhodocytophaga rosea]|uniref:Uncharacterized protein n=1 Tax=Rhodocytophaga rosea TaxID=2704465 RepID=A0A6C0GNW5_9BACT|nr:hypothetical protein [Rhodocytophaga rosea]QHT69738.1 hypothetical protein GXP67_25365 [Rhodocytophaga rosea]